MPLNLDFFDGIIVAGAFAVLYAEVSAFFRKRKG